MDDLAFGLQITAWGMGLVFGLLGLLWALLALVGWVESRAEAAATSRLLAESLATPVPEAAPAPAPLPSADGLPALHVRGPGADQLPPEALAAITAAVLAHVADRRRQAAPETRAYWPGSLLFASRWVIAGRTRQSRGHTRGRS